MKIGEDEVRHVAELAELAVADGDVPLLAAQLESIVTFVAQLDELGSRGDGAPIVMGPGRTPLRNDIVDPIPMTLRPSDIAPAFEEGFFVVPKLGGLAES